MSGSPLDASRLLPVAFGFLALGVSVDIFGDLDPEATYAAVGRALSSWEQMEAGFASLYSIFVGFPFQLEYVREFGNERAVFSKRLPLVQQSADRYYVKNINQENEGNTRLLLRDACKLSLQRNRIAHGIVEEITVHDLSEITDNVASYKRYALKAPWHAAGKLKMGSAGALASSNILDLGNEFIEIQRRISELIAALGH